MGPSLRQFCQAAVEAAILPALDAAGPPKLPSRTLGRTGIEVSILGFGSGSRFLMIQDEDKAVSLAEFFRGHREA